MNLSITPEQLPTGVCPSDLQGIWNLFAAYGSVVVPDSSGKQWVFSATKPSDQNVGWFQLDTLGRPVRPYIFAQGAWLSLHPIPPGMTMWWFRALPSNINTYDGGDASTTFPNATDLAGPMWGQATDINGNVIAAQFPLSAGTLPSGKVLNVGDTGGEENHALTIQELPPHTHDIQFKNEVQTGADTPCLTDPAKVGHPPDDTMTTQATGGSGTPAVVQAHNTLPLYTVGYLLMRSNRKYYAVT